MSVPDTLRYARAGLPFFTRHSDLEPVPALLRRRATACGSTTSTAASSARSGSPTHLAAGKRVAVVSPELHGRDPGPTWEEWRAWPLWTHPDVSLCTDHPHEAQEVFA